MVRAFLIKRLITPLMPINFTLLALSAPQAFAFKEYPLIDQRQIEAVISNHEINRITVVHDRIRQVFGADGAFSHEVDEEGGQLFIKPLKPQQTKPIHITIVTENGLTQDLKLTLADIDAETILLKQIDATSSALQNNNQQPLVYQEALIHLIQGMGRREEIAGFTKHQDGQDRSYPNGLQATVRTCYKGDLWQGQVYDLYNASQSSLDLKEQDFAQPGDLAVALQTHRLNPQSCTRLYVISKNQGDS